MAIRTLSDVAAAYDAGRHWTGLLRRSGPLSAAGFWQDLMYAPGVPGANYYAATPLTSAILPSNDGINCGPTVEAQGYKKYLHKALLLQGTSFAAVVAMLIYDIVVYYPFVDGDGGEQTMVNTEGSPPVEIVANRYGGENCHIMLVSQGVGTGSSNLTTITYEDANGDTKTIDPIRTRHDVPAGTLIAVNNGLSPGTNGFPGPLIPCPTGCNKILSFNTDIGVGGIFTICIVKPLGWISSQEFDGANTRAVPVEVDFFRDRLRAIEINDGSFIGMAYSTNSTAGPASTVAELTFIWS
jgi:hypothetical protein